MVIDDERTGGVGQIYVTFTSAKKPAPAGPVLTWGGGASGY